MCEETVLTLQNLCTGYRNARHRTHVVTQPFTARLERGRFVCLLGRNGAGKSTLLRTLTGFQPPLSGEILWFGRPISSYSPAERARMIGMVLTQRCPSDRLTVAETVRMGRMPYTNFWGKLQPDDELLTVRAMQEVGIEALAGQRIGTLSDGERQKTMIAKALAQQTPTIFLDEPTAFLDFPSKVKTMRLLQRLAHEQGKTIFASVHDLELALQFADELWVMDPGGHIATGKPRTLIGNGALNTLVEDIGATLDPDTLRYTFRAD